MQCSMMSKNQETEIFNAIRSVFGQNTVLIVSSTLKHVDTDRSHSLHNIVTHLVLPSEHDGNSDGKGNHVTLTRTEKLLSAIAKGNVWILSDKWVYDSVRARQLLDEAGYDFGEKRFSVRSGGQSGDELFVPPAHIRRRFNELGGLLKPWKALVLCRTDGQGQQARDALIRVLRHGQATVRPWTLQHLVSRSSVCI